MGIWAHGIFDDDTTEDIRLIFEEAIKNGASTFEATTDVLEMFPPDIMLNGTIVYLALASLQMEIGELETEIKEIALDIIETGKGLIHWERCGEYDLNKRKEVLNELKIELLEA